MDYVIFSDSETACDCGQLLPGLVVAIIVVSIFVFVAFPIIVTLIPLMICHSCGGSKRKSERYWLCPVLCVIFIIANDGRLMWQV